MANLILFVNSFLSYLFVLIFIVIIVIIACVLGVKWRKSSDAKLIEGVEVSSESESDNPEK